MSAGLVAEGLSVRLRGSEILREVSLSVAPSEVVAILGPSGAGKTTFFRALLGEVPTSAGTIRLGDRALDREPLWERARWGLGYVPQTPSVLWDLTVRDNLSVFEKLAGRGRPRGPSAWAEEISLSHRLAIPARDLSGGERRRLEIGRALIAEPKVLVCDEPFAGLDPISITKLRELLRRRADRGMGILLSDHHVAEALRICDRAALLLDGRIEAMGTPAELEAHPSLRQRYLGAVRGLDSPPPR